MGPKGVAIRIFITCWLVFALHFATNTVREIYPALSLADRLSFDVSEYAGLHPDIFELPGRGAFINNNPGASLLGAIPYALARPLIDRVVARVRAQRAAGSGPLPEYQSEYPMARDFVRNARERGFDVKFGAGAAVIQAGLMAPLSAGATVVMFVIVRALTRSTVSAALLSLLYAFATPVLYRTAQLNQNILVAHCALFAFALLWRPWDQTSAPRRRSYLLAGLLAGWAVVLDYSGLIVPAVLLPYAVIRRVSAPSPGRSARCDLLVLLLGVVASVGVLLAYQQAAFGNPFLPAQWYMPPAEFTDRGLRGISLPQLDLLWETAFGQRYGLFVSAPLLLAALVPGAWRRDGGRLVGPLELWTILAFCAAFFLFCAANQYGRMQFNSGVRHVVPVTPFLFLIAAGTLLRLPRAMALICGALATYWSGCLAMYRDVERGVGVIDAIVAISSEGLRLPWLLTLERLGYVQDTGSILAATLGMAGLVLLVVWWPILSPSPGRRRSDVVPPSDSASVSAPERPEEQPA